MAPSRCTTKAGHGSAELYRLLLAAAPDTGAVLDAEGDLPLQHAIEAGRTDAARCLLSAGLQPQSFGRWLWRARRRCPWLRTLSLPACLSLIQCGPSCLRPAPAWGAPCLPRWPTLPHRRAGWCSTCMPLVPRRCAWLRCAWRGCSGAQACACPCQSFPGPCPTLMPTLPRRWFVLAKLIHC